MKQLLEHGEIWQSSDALCGSELLSGFTPSVSAGVAAGLLVNTADKPSAELLQP